MSSKGTRRRNRATRPFMPLHGNRTVPHDQGSRIMAVGAEAMIDENNNQAATPGETEQPAPQAAPAPAGAEAEAPAGEAAFRAGGEDIDALRAERDSYLDLARRERADFDNYRKRIERDMKQMKRESLASFLKEFFTPLDDMDRVLQESVKNHSFDSLVTGVRIMEENFWRVLAKAGVRKIDAMGKLFDPNLHEAMAMVPSADAPPGTVLEVYEAGYKIDDFILRPARVVVSRAPDE